MMLAERLRHALAQGASQGSNLLTGDILDAEIPAGAAVVPAAVLVAIVDRPDPGVLLTVRDAALRKHAGQIAFPGGRIDPTDDGPVAGALREAEEEIGLPDRYRTVTGFQVTPVLGVIAPDIPLVPHTVEVADIFEVPLSFLLEPSNHLERAIEWQGRERHYYEILWRDRRIWGATAAMIVNLSRRLAWA
jgi:8-oxo-dGTP pyrophosphatase MutT (NUDIX family)